MTTRMLTAVMLTFLILTSCTRRLATKDFRWVPYQGNEILVFNSNTGDADTVFLLGAGRYINPADPLDIFPTNLETFIISARRTDPYYGNGYLEGAFLEVSASEESSPYLTLNFFGKDAKFYGGEFLDLKTLDDITLSSLQTKFRTYNDVVILLPQSYEFAGRSDFIAKVYWSKSAGLIRYEKQDGVYWELARKYIP